MKIVQSIKVPIYVSMAMDPAFGQQQDSDRTAITVVGTTPAGESYVFEALEITNNTPSNVTAQFLKLAGFYRPHVISTEVITAQTLYMDILNPGLIELGLPRITPYKPGTKMTKQQRILKLEPKMRAKKLFIAARLSSLITQLRSYPQVDHDDLVDSLAQNMQHVRPAAEVEMVRQAELYGEEEEDFVEENTRSHGWNVGLSTPRFGSK